MSSGTTRCSGSGLGTRAPLSELVGVALAEAAHEDVLAVLHRDAAHALHRLRGVAVGALRDLLGGHRADDADRGALRVERVADGAALRVRADDLRLELDRRGGEADVLLERLARVRATDP